MTGITQLTLYTEGFTRTPKEVNLIANEEIHPEEMAKVVEGLFNDFQKYRGIVAMTKFFSENEFSVQPEGQRNTSPVEEEYLISLIPEEMDGETPELARRDKEGDWEFWEVMES